MKRISGVFLSKLLILGIVCGSLGTVATAAGEKPAIKAVAFDAFPIFDPRPVEAVAMETFPEKGRELMRVWRSKQFEYQWLRALGGSYKDFTKTTEDALIFAARQLDLPLSDETRRKLMSPYANLGVWPDAKAAITALKAKGYKVVFLSNMTEEMLRSGLKTAGIEEAFDAVYSTDSRKTFKPSPQAYQMAVDGLGLSREEILFVAFAGWDAAGAKWFGYPTFWVNRAGASQEELGTAPDGAGRDMQALLDFLAKEARR